MSHLHFEMDFNWSCGVVKVKNRLKSFVIFLGSFFHVFLKASLKYHLLGMLL